MVCTGGEPLLQLDPALIAALHARGFSIGEPRRDGFLRSSTAGFNGFDVESAEAVNAEYADMCCLGGLDRARGEARATAHDDLRPAASSGRTRAAPEAHPKAPRDRERAYP